MPAYYKILDSLATTGKPLFDTVGIQSHMHGGVWPLHKVWDTCDTYSKLGRPLHFTESTIVSGPRKGPGENWGETTAEGEARQAEQTAKFYTALFAHPAVQAITWWDFSDLGAWQGAPAGWLRRDMSPKPVLRPADVIDQRRMVDEDGRDHRCPWRGQGARLLRHASHHGPLPSGQSCDQGGSLGAREENRFELTT